MSKPIQKVLIANRGEIALRIARGCHDMGIACVAVYSEADRGAPHVYAAEEAYCIGPPPSRESYLAIDKILEAAKKAGADSVHPGYGFLAENAEFAQACQDAGLIFIGPTPEAIRSLGSKIGAKRLMSAAGVPVVPGYEGEDQSEQTLQKEAEKIGFPLLIKASAGGGGKGMRVVHSSEQFTAELSEARRESKSAFGDDTVLLERYVENPRHIEFQIFGDTHGNAIHLFERECSIQRRHQKIIEETPSPALSSEMRERMAQAAVQAAKASGYVNAGTVEFLFEERPGGDYRFYFLEVNTRLQVEHPVTEMVTGLDLVRLQIEIASGKPLPITQEQARQFGHAIEARIYAEDPETGFLPSIGELQVWIPPDGPGARMDSGFKQGMEVTLHYDPMLAKLIVYGEDRPAALARMERALREFHVLGVKTNLAYLLDIIRHPQFIAGNTHTHFLTEHFSGWTAKAGTVPEEALLTLAAAEQLGYSQSLRQSSQPTDEADAFDPWHSNSGWRNAPKASISSENGGARSR